MGIITDFAHWVLLKKIKDPERAHEIAINIMAKSYFSPGRFACPASKVNLFGHTLDNPLGLAAGFDKNGVIEKIQDFGFAWSEIGSITYKGGKGNSKPRLFRYREQKSLGNRMGLNGLPAEDAAAGLSYITSPYGVNIAKTNDATIIGDEAVEDILATYDLVRNLGMYHVINLSCPNTEDGKTFEEPKSLETLLSAVHSHKRGKPLLVKLSPNLSIEKLTDVVKLAEKYVEGYVCTNTLPSAHPSVEWIFKKDGRMGVSGQLLKQYSISTIRNVRSLTAKPIIGVGGIFTGQDAYDAMQAGANVVQAYTGFVYRGVDFAHLVNKELLDLKERGTRKWF